MKNFAVLYRFEWKKLWKKKMVRYTFVILLFIVASGNISDLLFTSYRDEFGRTVGAYEGAMEARDYARKISGRAIDDGFLGQMRKAFGDSRVIAFEQKEEKNEAGTAMMISSYLSTAVTEDERPAHEIIEDHKKYRGVYTYVRSVIGYIEAQDADACGFYQGRQDLILEDCLEKQKLTKAELDVWTRKEERLRKPFVYAYCEGPSRLLYQVNAMNYVWIFLCAVCLSGVFSEEHMLKTDQIILCGRYGRLPLYLAKISAGVTFVLVGMVLFYAVSAALSLGIYGADGFGAMLQMCVWKSSWEISNGGAFFILFFVSLTAVVLVSVTAMFLSGVLKNGIAALAIMAGMTLLTAFVDIPARLKGLSMIYSLLPAKLIREDVFWDNRLFFIFGHGFYGIQIAPILYLAVAGILMRIGFRIYQNSIN